MDILDTSNSNFYNQHCKFAGNRVEEVISAPSFQQDDQWFTGFFSVYTFFCVYVCVCNPAIVECQDLAWKETSILDGWTLKYTSQNSCYSQEFLTPNTVFVLVVGLK